MTVSVTSNTDRFKLSVVGDDFINDCCFGEDFSHWLVSALLAMGIEAEVICMEDFGWANRATFGGSSYLIFVGGYSHQDSSRPNYGEWRVVVERHRTLIEKIRGKNTMAVSDPLVRKVEQVLMDEGFEDVAIEP
ncbi:hypothetical protein IV454_12710 [Massilia antarctica]|uniref:Uncharacterized protein n=1 Tax=Massilia antarctica TaxID=2765360 RepID=A0AA49AAT9_9BURK|nr:hypothetical protein [Massilia antarctica]QPI52262.1 hypothetical protein IV454_12710 [Massilia antarctica]